MVFPENEQFQNFFASITKGGIEKEKSKYDEIIIVDAYAATDHKREIPVAKKSIFLKKGIPIQFSSVIKKIARHLEHEGHASNQKICEIILYLYTFLPQTENHVQKMNELLSWISTSDVNQFIVFQIDNVDSFELIIEDFRLGAVETSKIERYCRRFKTDYFDLYGDLLQGRLALSRKHRKIKILDVNNVYKAYNGNYANLNEAVFEYFKELANYYFDIFQYEFHNSQNLLTLLEGGFISLDELNLLARPDFISIFLNIGNRNNEGWIIPFGKSEAWIEMANIDIKYKKYLELLREEYNFNEFGISQLDNTFKKYLEFISKAIRLLNKKRISESFLHYVIGLDLVFGERDISTQSVSRRTAFIVHKTLKNTLEVQTNKVKELYNLRSRYVHQGEDIPMESLIELQKICHTVFIVYLRLQSDKVFSSQITIDEWLKKIDWFIATQNAGETIQIKDLKLYGIVGEDTIKT